MRSGRERMLYLSPGFFRVRRKKAVRDCRRPALRAAVRAGSAGFP